MIQELHDGSLLGMPEELAQFWDSRKLDALIAILEEAEITSLDDVRARVKKMRHDELNARRKFYREAAEGYISNIEKRRASGENSCHTSDERLAKWKRQRDDNQSLDFEP